MYVNVFFFFKQKTAYEMRISDWSSDVCSSDLQQKNDQIRHLLRGARAAPGDGRLLGSQFVRMVDGALVHSGQDHARRNAVYGNALGSQFKRESGGELGEPPLCRIIIDAAGPRCAFVDGGNVDDASVGSRPVKTARSEEHTSELQSLMRISYAVF